MGQSCLWWSLCAHPREAGRDASEAGRWCNARVPDRKRRLVRCFPKTNRSFRPAPTLPRFFSPHFPFSSSSSFSPSKFLASSRSPILPSYNFHRNLLDRCSLNQLRNQNKGHAHEPSQTVYCVFLMQCLIRKKKIGQCYTLNEIANVSFPSLTNPKRLRSDR